MTNLALIYADLIIQGYKTIDQVPLKIRPLVNDALRKLGFPDLAEPEEEKEVAK